jgi:branched-chain amino acid transport system permease protein
MRRPSGIFDVSYLQDMTLFRTRAQQLGMVGLLTALILFPLIGDEYWLIFINTVIVTVIALQGLNILAGYCGQISIGHTAFMAVGAYGSAILAASLDLPFWVTLPCAGIGAGLVGLFFGLPALRIKGFYLAVVTIAAQLIIMYIIRTPFPDITGGAIALHVPPVSLGSFSFETETHFYYLILALGVVMTFVTKSLTRSHIGRAFVAIRDNDTAAEAMGISLYRYKLLAFFIGCFYAGVAGALWGAYMKVVSPDDFTLMGSIWQMGMLIVGGLGSTLGPFFGAVIIKALNELCLWAGPIIDSAIPQIGAQISAALVEMVFGSVLVIFLVYLPRGLAHRWEILKDSYRLWPFSY